MEKIKLSIVVPVYNVEKYIERCLKSLCELNIENEIIVVNDGSIDSSVQIVEKFKEKYINENIIIVNQENKGLSGARNTGIRKANGEYISFIDSDDFVDTEKYKEIINKTIENNLDVGLGNGIYYYEKNIDKKRKFITNDSLEKEEINSGREWLKKLRQQKSYRSEVWDKIYRRDFLIDNNIFFREGKLHEDEEFTVKVFLNAKKVKYFDLDFYNYFQENNNSIMKNKSLKNHYDMLDNAEYILKEIDDIEDEVLVEIIKNLVRDYFDGIYRQIIDLPKNNETKQFEKILKERYDKVAKKYNLRTIEPHIFKKIERKIRKYRDKLKKIWKENKI